jgi:hypothetical protein
MSKKMVRYTVQTSGLLGDVTKTINEMIPEHSIPSDAKVEIYVNPWKEDEVQIIIEHEIKHKFTSAYLKGREVKHKYYGPK